MFEKYKEYLQHSLSIITFLYNNTVFYHKIIRRENLDKAKNEEISNMVDLYLKNPKTLAIFKDSLATLR